MFRIRRVFDDIAPVDRKAMGQVQEILRAQFALADERDVTGLPAKLKNPVKYRFRYLLFVAETEVRGDVRGFALVSHEPELRFCYLDYLATTKKLVGSGVGGALYERLCEESRDLGVMGLFFECLPDDPAASSSIELAKQNAARLRFYERFGARPIVGANYEAPINPGDKDMPHLVLHDFSQGEVLRSERIRPIVRAILERKYAELCPPEYVTRVVESFSDETVRLREYKYIRQAHRPQPLDATLPAELPGPATPPPVPANGTQPVNGGSPAGPPAVRTTREQIVLIVNDKHDIHHVRERGYVEAPVRIRAILSELEPTGMFRRIEPKEFPESHIREVHQGAYVDYLKRVCSEIGPGKSVYPYVFPLRNAARAPKDLAVRAGYYCMDTFTPLNLNAYLAAKRAVDCTMTAAEAVLRGSRLAYALVRPPGHHAEHCAFGGFCYFNNNAVAAQYFSKHGRVAILDIDYHHGNGQEVIFYDRKDVLTVSIHGNPRFAYPYFSGFADERGGGEGAGYNLNLPLPESVDGNRYREALERACARIRRFAPSFLVVALGLDTAKGDPTGSWSLTPRDLEENGRILGGLRLPTLIVQEGGYRTRTLGINALSFFAGLAGVVHGWPRPTRLKSFALPQKPIPDRRPPAPRPATAPLQPIQLPDMDETV
jgi:acetoin utilization deacetylase AcuC-like enzyme/GNAT superfamily N-acetyltransferase